MKEILEKLASGVDLSREEAAEAFGRLLGGDMTPVQAGAFLMGLRAKGETADELATGVEICLEHARLVEGLPEPRIDTCGTGGDGQCSFNCSTAVALVLASMGHKVVKHGNRSVSSKCGSADVLEAMGLPLDTPAEKVADELAAKNFVFLFAPAYHPAFKHIVPVRKDLAIRTLFNLMGPLLNPARPTHQIVGAASEPIAELMAEALSLPGAGVERAAVVHGAGGFDELTPFGPSTIFRVAPGRVERETFDPAPLGMFGGKAENVAVSGPEESLQAMRELLRGQGPWVMQDMLIINLALALSVLDASTDMNTAFWTAKEAVLSGQAGVHFEVRGG
jgi:anthranilate phosphoribosyltransferase